MQKKIIKILLKKPDKNISYPYFNLDFFECNVIFALIILI